MQWHWGNIGSAVAGASALIIAVAALIRSPAALRAWIARQRAETEAAHEQAETARLERRRGLSGWSPHGVDTFTVALVTTADEMTRAQEELVSGSPTGYVILRVAESDQEYGNANRALRLRQIIEHEQFISRPPTAGEREALEAGLDVIGIPHVASKHRAVGDHPLTEQDSDGEGPAEDTYWVYEDTVTHDAVLHRGNCPHCNHGAGKGKGRDERVNWWRSYASVDEARSAPLRPGTKPVRDCGTCMK
jgi:hypothetical protein